MAENLNYAGLSDTVSFCYNNEIAMCEKYGRFYIYTATMGLDYDCGINVSSCDVTYPVQGVCPKGWHVPDEDEWNQLFENVGGTIHRASLTRLGKNAADQLWDKNVVNNMDDSEEYGFSLLPAGYMLDNGGFGGLYNEARYWCSGIVKHPKEDTYGGLNFHVRFIVGEKDASVMEGQRFAALNAYSVRCVQD